MPILKVTLTCGASDAQKLDLFENLTAAVHKALQAPPGNIRIVLNEIPRANWWHAEPPLGAPSFPSPTTAEKP